MVFVYALANKINNEIYIGLSISPERRLQEHNSGKNRYTKAFIPWSIVFQESFPDYKSARIREKYFKTAAGKRFLKHVLS